MLVELVELSASWSLAGRRAGMARPREREREREREERDDMQGRRVSERESERERGGGPRTLLGQVSTGVSERVSARAGRTAGPSQRGRREVSPSGNFCFLFFKNVNSASFCLFQ
jgi:hypothetical protein